MIDRITIEILDRWEACRRQPGERYDDERLKALGFGGKGLPTIELAREKRIPLEDRIWALLRSEVLGEDEYERLGYVFACRAVERHALHCGISTANTRARCWLSGEDRSSAAWAAAAAAWAAAAAEAAGGKRARARERRWQLDRIIEVLERA